MTHIRILDNPKGKWLRAGQMPPLGVEGTFALFNPGDAYEGRLQIVNNIGDCAVRLTSGTLPPGYELTVDNATHEVVLTWPAYEVLVEGSSDIPNSSFADGSTGWILGAGLEVGDWEWIYDGDDNNQQSYDGDDRSIEYHAGFRGNTRARSAFPRKCAPGTEFNAHCQVQQGPSDHDNTGGWVLVHFFDANMAELEVQEGSHIDSGENAEWHMSTVAAVAPASTAYAVIGGECYRKKENKPMWLDAFSWDLPTLPDEVVGTIGTDDIPLSLEVIDSGGRRASWSGVVPSLAVVAQQLLSDLDYYFPMDGDLDDVITGAVLVPTGSGPTYQAGVGGDQEARFDTQTILSVLTGQGPLAAGPITEDFSYWFVLHPIGTASSPRGSVSFRSDPADAQTRFLTSIYASGTSVRSYVKDGVTHDYDCFSGDTVVPGTRYFVRVNVDWAACTVTQYIDEIEGSVSTPADAMWYDADTLMLGANTNTAGDSAPDFFSKFGIIVGRHTTEAEGAYIYNGGAIRDYDDFLADAS